MNHYNEGEYGEGEYEGKRRFNWPLLVLILAIIGFWAFVATAVF